MLSQHPGSSRSLDEEEELKNWRWDNLRRFKYCIYGLRKESTGDFQELYQTIRSYGYDFVFTKPVSDFQFKKVLNDSLYWGESSSWKKVLLPYQNRNASQKLEMSDTTKTKGAIKPCDVFCFFLSFLEPGCYSNEVLMSRATKMLEAEIKYFSRLGIGDVAFDIAEIPTNSDLMERLLCILLRVVQQIHLKGEKKCTLLLNFRVQNEKDSVKFLEWFKRFQKSCIEKSRLRPAINLFKNATIDSMSGWFSENPAYLFIFIDRGHFRTLAKNPHLTKLERKIVIKFMEVGATIVLDDSDEWCGNAMELNWYQDYFNLIWRYFLETGHYYDY